MGPPMALGWNASIDLYLATRAAFVFDVGWTLPQTASSRGLNPRIGKGQQLPGDRDAQVATSDTAVFDQPLEARAPTVAGRPEWRSHRRARTR